jgi:hypothetical protein
MPNGERSEARVIDLTPNGLEGAQHLGEVGALVEQPLAFADLADDLLGGVAVSLHVASPPFGPILGHRTPTTAGSLSGAHVTWSSVKAFPKKGRRRTTRGEEDSIADAIASSKRTQLLLLLEKTLQCKRHFYAQCYSA